MALGHLCSLVGVAGASPQKATLFLAIAVARKLSTFVDIADALETVHTVNLSLSQVVAVDGEDSRGVHTVWHIEEELSQRLISQQTTG
jgi:hypothetical protein